MYSPELRSLAIEHAKETKHDVTIYMRLDIPDYYMSACNEPSCAKYVPEDVITARRGEYNNPLWLVVESLSGEPNLIETIAEEIRQHYIDNPTHGVGCSCLDNYIRKIRSWATITPYWLHHEDRATERGANAMKYILRQVSESMYRNGAYKKSIKDGE